MHYFIHMTWNVWCRCLLQGVCFTNVGHLMSSAGSSTTLRLMDYKNPNKPAKSILLHLLTVTHRRKTPTVAPTTPQVVPRKSKANNSPRPSLCMPLNCPATRTNSSFSSPALNWYVTAFVYGRGKIVG